MAALTGDTFRVTNIDGTTFTTRPVLRDTVAYETTARKHRWGTIGDNFATAQAFIIWHALKRTEQIPAGLNYDAWLDGVDSIEVIEAPVGDEPAGPTLPDRTSD